MPWWASAALSGPHVLPQQLTLSTGVSRPAHHVGVHQVHVAVPGPVGDALDLSPDPRELPAGKGGGNGGVHLAVQGGDGQRIGSLLEGQTLDPASMGPP